MKKVILIVVGIFAVMVAVIAGVILVEKDNVTVK